MFFLVKNLSAELVHTDLYGVHQLFSKKASHLSPLRAYTLLDTKTLAQIRFYGNYGAKKKGFGCLEHAKTIHTLLVKKNDCPQDAMTELLQRLFPSQDGVNFVANQIDSDVASHLSPKLIGEILQWMSQVQDDDLNLKKGKKEDELVKELQDILFRSINPQGYKNIVQADLAYLQKKAKGCAAKDRPIFETQIQGLAEKIEKLGEAAKGKGKTKNFQELAKLIWSAMKETRLQNGYPKHLPEHALMAYFLKKANHRDNLHELLAGMPAVLVENWSEKLQEIKRPLYIPSDGTLKEQAQELISNPEKLIYLVKDESLKRAVMPPNISYQRAKDERLQGVTVDSRYPDCGETSLRNFFNILLFNTETKKFDVDILKNLMEKDSSLKISPQLFKYYEKHRDPQEAAKEGPRDDWNLVVASHQGVDYLKPENNPVCEINAGVDNMLTLIERLFFNGDDSQKLTKDRLKRQQNLDKLFEIISTHDRKYTWKLAAHLSGQEKNVIDQHNTDVTLQVSINGKPSFNWAFGSGHFVVSEIPDPQKSWMDQIGGEFAEHLLSLSQEENEEKVQKLQEVLEYMPWLVNGKNLDTILKKIPQEIDPSLLLFATPLSDQEAKLTAFKNILNHRLENLYPLARKIQESFPVDDTNAQRVMSIALSDNHYPWHGDTVKTYSGVEFTRVKEGDQGYIAQMAPLWRVENLIWSDVARNEDGSIKKMNHYDAAKYCQPDMRLPTKEEYEKLRIQLGRQTATGYIPQILANLSGNWFWSASAHPDFGGAYYIFLGHNGKFYYYGRDDKEAVRCVRVAGL